MKITAALTAFVLGFASMAMTATAQEPDREAAKQEFKETVTDTMERLELTDEQKPRVQEILTESMGKRMAILDSYGVKEGEKPNLGLRQLRSMRGEMNEVREDTLSKMGGVLTADQLAEFKVIQEEMQAKMRERMRARR